MTTLIVFAKAPEAGLVKTRLITALGPAGAARLADRLLRHAVQQALAAGLGTVDLCVSPDAGHPVFAELAASATLQVSLQGEGDLGQRMSGAFCRVLAHDRAALLIGTDAPAVDAACLRRAAAALHSHDAVFVPAADGGYALVGLKRPAPALFDGMQWSHAQVMADTRAQLAASGLRHLELPTVHDIDRPADLTHLPAAWRPWPRQ